MAMALAPRKSFPTDDDVKLLPGEILLAKARKILRFNRMTKRGSGLIGCLFVTNFRITFRSTKVDNDTNLSLPQNLENLLTEDNLRPEEHIPHTCVSIIQAVSTSKQKSKALKHDKKLSLKYDIVEIQCKDFRIIPFDFKLCAESERHAVIQAISHYAFPNSFSRLFAFDYGSHVTESNSSSTSDNRAFYTFRHDKDYELELSRLNAGSYFRVSRINTEFKWCKSLPELIVCPLSLSDEALQTLAQSYPNQRCPVWSWSHPLHHASLMTSSITKATQDSSLFHSHSPALTSSLQLSSDDSNHVIKVISVDLTDHCPTTKELKTSFKILADACTFRTGKDFWSSDSSWLSKLEGSRWLEYVEVMLQKSSEIASLIDKGVNSVILCDDNGREFVCLFASLIQILLDPFYRTLIGFQTLLQKEWVAKGFPFLTRFSLFHMQQKSSRQYNSINLDYDDRSDSPIFILFFDCIHQLMKQFPNFFEFTEQFLVLIIDSIHACVFETFLFNSEFDRKKFQDGYKLESLWDFVGTTIPAGKLEVLFYNPIYNVAKLFDGKHNKLSDCDLNKDFDELENDIIPEKSYIQSHLLIPVVNVSEFSFWHEYFLRWLPSTDLHKGFSSQTSRVLQQKELLDELHYLELRQIQLETRNELPPQIARDSFKPKARKRSKYFNNVLSEQELRSLMSDFSFCNLFSFLK